MWNNQTKIMLVAVIVWILSSFFEKYVTTVLNKKTLALH